MQARAMNEPEETPMAQLRAIGLRIPISDSVAAKIWAALLIVDGQAYQGLFNDQNGQRQRYAAYHAIAEGLVQKDTPNDVLENIIPEMIQAFSVDRKWLPYYDMALLKRVLHGPMTEWKGKRLLKAGESIPDMIHLSPLPTTRSAVEPESLQAQLNRLREECRLTAEQLAEKVRLDPSSVSRHIAGKVKPQLQHLGAYEKLFSKLLNRKVVIQIPPSKCK